MKLLILTREISNGGDYLIKMKTREVLERVAKNVDFSFESGFNNYDEKLDYLQSFDGILICGGPIYDNKFLNKDSFPLFGLVDKLTIPIHFLGAGWYGRYAEDKDIYNYEFTSEAKKILQYTMDHSGYLGCRDYNNAGIEK